MPYAVDGSACCALPSDHRPKIQPMIIAFLAGEFRRQPALGDSTVILYFNLKVCAVAEISLTFDTNLNVSLNVNHTAQRLLSKWPHTGLHQIV